MAWPNRDDNDDTRKKYEKDRETNREITENHELIMALSKIVESAFESGFQFFFQSVFKLPSLLLSITSHRAGSSWKDLVNWATASIALSFLSFAWTYTTIRYISKVLSFLESLCYRKRDKRGALTFEASAVLVLKVTLDCVSRVLIFSSFLYVINHGVFSSIYTLIAFYLVFTILVIFNMVFNDSNNFSSGRYWLGLPSTDYYDDNINVLICRNHFKFFKLNSKLQ